MENNQMFPRRKIKAGYLLVVRDEGKNTVFNMTVVPSKGLDDKKELGCCCPGREWWPLQEFDEDLISDEHVVLAIYDRTCNRYLLDNSLNDRTLLWKRPNYTAEFTTEKISQILGVDVKIVPES